MASLGSPGVQVNVINESFYTPSTPNTVPFIFVVTPQDKLNPSGGVAQGTTAANNGKVWYITSQRDLTDTFGSPTFTKDSSGAAIQGSETSEYGLHAAYSVLGVTSRAYIARADVNLGEIVSTTTIPEGDPVSGTYWVETDASLYGVYEWNSTTNSGRGAFSAITPKIIDDDNVSTAADTNLVPLTSFGSKGDYAMVVTADNENSLYYKDSSNAWVLVTDGFDSGKEVAVAPHTSYPDFTTATGSSAVTGSIWIKTTTPGKGANWTIKYYNGSTKTWGNVGANIYTSTRNALEKLDYAGGGENIAAGTLFIESNYAHDTDPTATFKIWRRNSTGETKVVSEAITAAHGVTTSTFTIKESLASSSAYGPVHTITIAPSTTTSLASLIPAAISASTLTNVSASYDNVSKKVTFSHALGGDFMLNDGTNTPLADLGLTAYDMTTLSGTPNLYATEAGDTPFDFLASNWKPLVYQASMSIPTTDPVNGTLWFDGNITDVDILIHDGTTWVGYANEVSGVDPAGPIVRATEPVDGDRSDGGSLVDGDIWVSTADPDRYGLDLYVYDGVLAKWIAQDTADQSSPSGWLFADARWSTAGADTDPASITDLLLSDYLDPDAPDPALYPKGMRLWNTRRSGNVVKKYVVNHLDLEANDGLNTRYNDESMVNYTANRWISITPNNADGSGAFGRHAQRQVVITALKSFIDSNTDIRDTDTLSFNLLACPGYPELIANLVQLNSDRGNTAFVVGDTPMRLAPTASALTAWGMNTAEATDNGDSGLVTSDEYLGVFYPSGLTTDLKGTSVMVPASHMMLRTIINSDAKSYQWFAPAGTRRGTVDNASSVGYLNSLGEFKAVSLYEGLRDVLHDVKINPIATLPGIGLVNFGQYTRAATASALDRINVSRLVAYLRRQLAVLAKPFLFEPNDEQTRREIKSAAESLLIELVGQRALYDFIVVCDTTNNTPARIDKSELYMDIAVEPVKAVEFIYIPLRIKNTGEIAAGL